MHFHCKVLSPTAVIFEEEVLEIEAPGIKGPLKILPHHIEFLSELTHGVLTLIKKNNNEAFSLTIQEGFLIFSHNKAVILL